MQDTDKYHGQDTSILTWQNLGAVEVQMGETLLRNVWWMLRGSARVRYDKTTDVISDRSRHKYAGYLTPLLPIAAASPDCQPRPLPPPKPPLLFPAPKLPAEDAAN